MVDELDNVRITKLRSFLSVLDSIGLIRFVFFSPMDWSGRFEHGFISELWAFFYWSWLLSPGIGIGLGCYYGVGEIERWVLGETGGCSLSFLCGLHRPFFVGNRSLDEVAILNFYSCYRVIVLLITNTEIKNGCSIYRGKRMEKKVERDLNYYITNLSSFLN